MEVKVGLRIRRDRVEIEYVTGGRGVRTARYVVRGGSRGVPREIETMDTAFVVTLRDDTPTDLSGIDVLIRIPSGPGHALQNAPIKIQLGQGAKAQHVEARASLAIGGVHSKTAPRILQISGRLERTSGTPLRRRPGSGFAPPYVPVYPD